MYVERRLVWTVSNEWVLKEFGLKGNLIVQRERSTIRWFGHVERMSVDRMTKQVYEGRVIVDQKRQILCRLSSETAGQPTSTSQVLEPHAGLNINLTCIKICCQTRNPERSYCNHEDLSLPSHLPRHRLSPSLSPPPPPPPRSLPVVAAESQSPSLSLVPEADVFNTAQKSMEASCGGGRVSVFFCFVDALEKILYDHLISEALFLLSDPSCNH
uniref:Uncharacterized protein n=1 Tax=Timema tahoe TaxID=61484 RepID=A0A7R9IKX6_9NEOP|nr:unnamed protein product [Timema tahoe]